MAILTTPGLDNLVDDQVVPDVLTDDLPSPPPPVIQSRLIFAMLFLT